MSDWNLKSKRFLDLQILNLLWACVGFAAGQWETFGAMIIPMVTLNGAYIIGETWRPTGVLGSLITGQVAGKEEVA